MKIENIKFKAKRLDNGEWVKGYFYEECGNTYIIEDRQSDSSLNRNIPHAVDPTTVCLFTGLKDENGKEVWEHDILEFLNLEVEVVFYKGCFHVEKEDSFSYSFPILNIRYDKLGCWRVVGCKFDRKEGEK